MIVPAAITTAAAFADPVLAKTPGGTYCFNQICHRVFTLKALAALIGREVVHETSYYDGCRQDAFNPCGLTSSGEVFRPGRPDNAASPIYPDGTTLLVYHPETRKAAVVRVNNAGPYWGRRKLDVSRAVADKLGFRKRGLAALQVMVIGVPTESEARYRQRRRYDRVPGPIGEHASLEDARRAISGLLLTTNTRITDTPPGDLVDGAPGSGIGNAGHGPEDDQVPTLASVRTDGLTTTRVAATAPGPSALRALDRPFATAAFPPPGPALVGPRSVGEQRPIDPTPGLEHLESEEAPATMAPDPSADALAPTRLVSFAIAAAPTRSLGAGRIIEIVATRRHDVLDTEQQTQPVLAMLPLDVSADLMERDLTAGRVTLFARSIPLTTLVRQPTGRLGLFAHAAVPARAIEPRKTALGLSGRVSQAVHWTRTKVSAITNVVMREPGR